MTTDQEIFDFYKRAGQVPVYSNLATIKQAARRQRAKRRIAFASIAAAAVAITSVGAGQLFSAQSPAPPSQGRQSEAASASPSRINSPTPSRPFINVQPGAAAPAGSMVYRDCASGCRLLLQVPGGEPIDLGARIPELQSPIERAENLEEATLSYDAQWLGIPDGQVYLVANMREEGTVARVPAAPEGQRWTPIGWTPSSGSLALARTHDDTVTGFAMVETFDMTGRQARVHTLDHNPLPGWAPFYNGGDSVLLVKRPEPLRPVTTLLTQTVFVSSDQFDSGEHFAGEPIDLGRCLKEDETLTPDVGSLAVFTPPPPEAPNVGEGAYTTLVVAFDAQSSRPSAILGLDCSRREIPGESGSTPVPRTTDSTLTERVSDSSTQVVLQGPNAVERVVFDHRSKVPVILPGG